MGDRGDGRIWCGCEGVAGGGFACFEGVGDGRRGFFTAGYNMVKKGGWGGGWWRGVAVVVRLVRVKRGRQECGRPPVPLPVTRPAVTLLASGVVTKRQKPAMPQGKEEAN